MSAPVTYVRAHSVETVTEMVEEAVAIAEAVSSETVTHDVIFRAAVDLLSVGGLIQAPQLPYDLSGITGKR